MNRSNRAARCIYTCPEGLCAGQAPLHPNEHYLPAGLGNFKDDVHLKDFICNECQRRFSKFESVFLQNSPEAFFRKVLGVKGRSGHKPKNIFSEPTHGLSPLTVKAIDPRLGRETLWEMVTPNDAVPVYQLVFEKADGTLEHVPIRTGKVAQDLQRFGDDWKAWRLVCCISHSEDHQELNTALGSMLDGMHAIAADEQRNHEISGEMRAQITVPYLQAISKIAFHFVLARFHFNGLESEFDTIKRFIYHGTGEPPAKMLDQPLLPQLLQEEAYLRNWSHILSAEYDRSSFVSRMQFFLGPQLKTPYVWRVNLGRNPSHLVQPDAKGFHFFYYEEPDKSDTLVAYTSWGLDRS